MRGLYAEKRDHKRHLTISATEVDKKTSGLWRQIQESNQSPSAFERCTFINPDSTACIDEQVTRL